MSEPTQPQGQGHAITAEDGNTEVCDRELVTLAEECERHRSFISSGRA